MSAARFSAVLILVCVLAGTAMLPQTQAQPQGDFVVTEDARYDGPVLQTLRGVDQEVCQAECRANDRCHAFTFEPTARLCTLIGPRPTDVGPLTQVPGMVAGLRVNVPPGMVVDLERERRNELLVFLPGSYVDDAANFIAELPELFTPGDLAYAELVTQGTAQYNARRYPTSASRFGAALALNHGDPDLWLRFGRAAVDINANAMPVPNYRPYDWAISASINSYIRSDTEAQRAAALFLLGDGLSLRLAQQNREDRGSWRSVIKAYREGLALAPSEMHEGRLVDLVEEYGFDVVRIDVEPEAASPRICVTFTDPIPHAMPGLADYMTVDGGGGGLAFEPEQDRMCVSGVVHGGRYFVRVRAGFPALDNEVLAQTRGFEVLVPDRTPWIAFSTGAYILPAGPDPTVPLQSVNADAVEIAVYRVSDRNLVHSLRSNLMDRRRYADEDFLASGAVPDTDDGVENGRLVWTGTVEIENELNVTQITAIPVAQALGNAREPGAYVIVARLPDYLTVLPVPGDSERDEVGLTSQWFVVTDLGLTALRAADGFHVFVRSLQTAQAVANVHVALIAGNNDILAEGTTDAAGYLRFEPGLALGTGNRAPGLISAETGTGDLAFLDLARSPFDLSDRGVTGRMPPGGIDVYLRTERGVYRPGDTVYATALARDGAARALANLPLILVVSRPDGVEYSRTPILDQGLGGYYHFFRLLPNAMRGTWRIKVYADPQGPPIDEEAFLVEDFVPERLRFEATATADNFQIGARTPIEIRASYLYGAAAGGLRVDGEIDLVPVRAVDAYPGYVFGRIDDPMERVRRGIAPSAPTDAEGQTTVFVDLPSDPEWTTGLVRGDVTLRMTDTDGRAVVRTLERMASLNGPRIGLRVLGDGGTTGRAEADVITIDEAMAQTALEGLEWELLRTTTTFQWYHSEGRWQWEPVTTTERVASGQISTSATGPQRIAVAVDRGSYRLELTLPGPSPTSTSVDFFVGWYVTVGPDTPDVLQIALDKPSYRVGDIARLSIDPEFAGHAIINVVDDRLITTASIQVPVDGITLNLPVTEEWGTGAYVTATIFRPLQDGVGRLPARALGLIWAQVDPGDRNLNVLLDLPEEVRPRTELVIPVQVSNLPPGTEAYITVAAVDLGVLLITRYEAPQPDHWFFAQHALGTEIRDLYGNLIDPSEGVLGVVRSGGDRAARFQIPPPSDEFVAQHSGVVRVDDNGRATVTFPIPNFNGTFRVMVQVWSDTGVGHAFEDVLVRDPVVVATAAPRFLNYGDSSRILIEIDNLAGPAGAYQLLVESGNGIGIDRDDERREVALEQGGRQTILVPITADRVGPQEIRVSLVMPGGEVLFKRLSLPVFQPAEPTTVTTLVEIPGNGGALALEATALDGFIRGTRSLSVVAESIARFDVAALLVAHQRYPEGNSEQLTSRALPLLYLNDLMVLVGGTLDNEVRTQVVEAVRMLLSMQNDVGTFGIWRPEVPGEYDFDSEVWLNAYIVDFLSRAREKEFDVPDRQFELALDFLTEYVGYASSFVTAPQRRNQGASGPGSSSSGPSRGALAYSLYVLAREGRSSLTFLRYLIDQRLDDFGTALAQAHIGAAISFSGDAQLAEEAFLAAIDLLTLDNDGARDDYGSNLRDAAAIIALAVESGVATTELDRLADALSEEISNRDFRSVQESAWTLMAAIRLMDNPTSQNLTLNGNPVERPLLARFGDEQLGDPAQLVANSLNLVNVGLVPVQAAISVTGVQAPGTSLQDGRAFGPLAAGNGMTISREYRSRDGSPIALSTVAQNDRFVVVLTVSVTDAATGRLLIFDLIPAGFEIENPSLTRGELQDQYPWLDAAAPDYTAALTDRFVAAITRTPGDDGEFTIAYTVRAVSPGEFIHPEARVENMHSPEWRANTNTRIVTVVGPTR